MSQFSELYKKYYKDRGDERLGLFQLVAKQFDVQRAMYAGSYVHVTPSFVIPEMVYVDSDKKAKKVFVEMAPILEFIENKKEYQESPRVTFYGASYTSDFGEDDKSVDLLISQYAGFISQACKRYLKIGGILLVNNSHGDASMAYLDDNYELIGAINQRNGHCRLVTENLASYFIPKKKDLDITKAYLEKHQRGIGYTKSASVYLFERIK